MPFWTLSALSLIDRTFEPRINMIVCTAGVPSLTRCLLIIPAGAWDWKSGSHRVRAWKCCPETPWSAARLREIERGRERGRERDWNKVWHRNLLCLLVLLRFTSCLVSTERVNVWQDFCLSAIFPEEARPPQPHSWRSHRVAYSRCTLQLDVHTNNTQVRAYRAFACVTFQKISEERRLVQLHFLRQSRLCFCKRISSAF